MLSSWSIQQHIKFAYKEYKIDSATADTGYKEKK